MKAPARTLVALLLSAAAWTAHAADKVTVQLDWLPGGDKSFVYAGVKEGFFAAEGLEVTIVPGRGSADAVTKIASGSADVGFGGISALMMAAAEGGVPVKAVMSIYAKQPDAIFTTKGSSIKSLKDVVGKTVATSTFSSSNTLWPVILEANGIDASKVKLLKVDPATLAPMLAQGRVDATINWVTVGPAAESVLKQAGKELNVLPWSAAGLDGYGWSAFASDRMIKERPEVLKRYLRALQKSLQFAIANPEKAAEDHKALVPESDPAVIAAEFRSSIPLIDNEISKRDGLGTFEPKLLAATWTWVAKSMNYPQDKVDPETLVDRRFLSK
ncbi:ABC transporter substrate-binding protein [Caldimonas thermodepolymerans]|jgi:ABC-type nitrate/sulfonate/bicarbonate transport systems, periplasmic components|uniref:Sulfonate/nitrate transporter n=1 Tax=Caldimonas thermodepolymerans TaxID=215580 RepID=A0A2S5T417_9BURK|nr:ABC transporter substrate-binding protein [Caldimonas thermodepolymerans]PPE69696.1 sulfonate/nitrate transporter [Caldimonas thermodepolymerans]QPC31893.1 ABC transporter substrate-binding protein [Caldimonas thermodepolymerans]RDI01590.1 NitT/TauT family transport system substrate-binding protein [Caldimonas thermodepolymerans]